MCPSNVKRNVQDISPDASKLSKLHWHEALRLARKELRQIESRAKALRKTIPVFERLVRQRKAMAASAVR